MQLLIVCYPESQIICMVTEENDNYDAIEITRCSCFYSDLINTIDSLMKNFPIDVITVYGNNNYAQRIADDVRNWFLNIKVIVVE